MSILFKCPCSAVAEEHAAVFSADRTQNVIVRLRHNVIRTGLRRINLAYSRIGLADVAAKLGLPDAGDVECIVAKAIKCAAWDAKLVMGSHRGHTLRVSGSAKWHSLVVLRVTLCELPGSVNALLGAVRPGCRNGPAVISCFRFQRSRADPFCITDIDEPVADGQQPSVAREGPSVHFGLRTLSRTQSQN